MARILHVPFCVRYEGALLQAEMIAHAYGALAFSASISSSLEQSSFISPRLGHSSQLLNIWDIFISDHLEPALQMALDKCVP